MIRFFDSKISETNNAEQREMIRFFDSQISETKNAEKREKLVGPVTSVKYQRQIMLKIARYY